MIQSWGGDSLPQSYNIIAQDEVTGERENLQVTLPRTRPPEVVPRQPVGMEYADKL
ncbi:hypothetical protein KI387_021126, partial [Taxus chinensis]